MIERIEEISKPGAVIKAERIVLTEKGKVALTTKANQI